MNKYLLLLVSFAISYGAYGQASPETSSGIGYISVSAAYEMLSTKEGVEGSNQKGWVIFKDSTDNSLWSFTPLEHPAYPSAIKRTVVEENGEIVIEMRALCGAEKLACDELIRAFRKMNEKKKSELNTKRVEKT
jgi:hypothetical protein|tara:strand:- start:518 stop:919 length:402 start_codon:yes stop_codon:yes gene_type:complete